MFVCKIFLKVKPLKQVLGDHPGIQGHCRFIVALNKVAFGVNDNWGPVY